MSLGKENLQAKEEFKPSNSKKLTNQQKNMLVWKEIEASNIKFRKYRLNYIAAILNVVEHENNDVDKKLQELKEVERVCTNEKCKKKFKTVSKKCDLCKAKVEKVDKEFSRFSTPENWDIKKSFNVGQIPLINPQKHVMGEPVMVNPNSFQRVKQILDEHKTKHDIGKEREWIILGCDGPPFRMANVIVQKETEKCDWVYLVPGLGHLHMNQLKTIFKILDRIMLEPLGKEILHFDSPKAYKFFIDAKDTHKAFQTLQILLHGTSAEFCKIYIDYCKGNTLSVSPEGFLTFLSDNENETFGLVGELIFNFTLSIYIQKLGARCNDADMISAGRCKFLPLFYTFRHPIYQDIECFDLINIISLPQEVRKLLKKNMTFTSSRLKHNHEGGDFILEGKIKKHKMVAPKGPISADTWRTISRGIDEIEEICEKAEENLHVLKDDTYRDIDLHDEIAAWRHYEDPQKC